MKDSALRRQILEDVLGEKADEYENFHKSNLNLNKRQHRKLIPLWKFLLHLLSRDKKATYIEWTTERALEFRILDTQSVAELWGSMKNKTDMTYEKLGRAMRYYYGKSIIEKVNGKRYSYRFILSRRTKKYISQFVNIKGMKVEPIDSRTGLPHLNSDSASIGSAASTSEEDEINLLCDLSSPSLPASPISPIKVKRLKPVKTTKTTRRSIQKENVSGERSKSEAQSEFHQPEIHKREVTIKVEEIETEPCMQADSYNNISRSDETFHQNAFDADSDFDRKPSSADLEFDRNQYHVNAEIDRLKCNTDPDYRRSQSPTGLNVCSNQSNVDTSFDSHMPPANPEFYRSQLKLETVIDRNESAFSTTCEKNQSYKDTPMDQEDLIDTKSTLLSQLQLYAETTNNLDSSHESAFHSFNVSFNKHMSHSFVLLHDEYYDSDLSSLTGSMSSDDFDQLEYIDIDYLDNGLNRGDFKVCGGDVKTKCQVVNENQQKDVKLNRQIDPFMGCDFVRPTECERSNFDMSFSDILEECLF